MLERGRRGRGGEEEGSHVSHFGRSRTGQMGFMKSSSRKERDTTSARPFLLVTRWQARCYFKAGFHHAAVPSFGDVTTIRG